MLEIQRHVFVSQRRAFVKLNSQSGTDARAHLCHRLFIQNPKIINPLTIFLALKQKTQSMKSNCHYNITLNPHRGAGIGIGQRRIKCDLQMMRQNRIWGNST